MLRKLTRDVHHVAEGANRRRKAQEAAYRFMSAMASNTTRFEDATRTLFTVDATAFESFTQSWSADVCDFARELTSRAFQP